MFCIIGPTFFFFFFFKCWGDIFRLVLGTDTSSPPFVKERETLIWRGNEGGLWL
jgi:hypothetical protein